MSRSINMLSVTDFVRKGIISGVRVQAGLHLDMLDADRSPNTYRFIAKTEVVIGRSQPEPRSGEGCDQADHGRPVEAMKVFLATVSHRMVVGHAALKLTKPASKHRFFLWNSTTPSRKRTRCVIKPWSKRFRQ